MSADYCLYPNSCGIGADCSECMSAEITRLRARLAEIEGQAPVSWQFYDDGKWHNGDDRMRDHRKNTEEAGYPIRNLYAAPVAPAVPEWQPIETAPQDGTYLLLTNGDGVWIGRWQPLATSGHRFPNPWRSMMLSHEHIPQKLRGGPVTCWMPLPAAPNEGGE